MGFQDLEDEHNYIQWLFPTRTKSQFNPDAKVLTDQEIQRFKKDPVLKKRLLRSLDLMLDFYGLKRTESRIRKTSQFEIRSKNWLTPRNHNFLRITRILESLSLLGLNSEAKKFYSFLRNEIEPEYSEILGNSMKFWKDAAKVSEIRIEVSKRFPKSPGKGYFPKGSAFLTSPGQFSQSGRSIFSRDPGSVCFSEWS